jgi:hypothetical protein
MCNQKNVQTSYDVAFMHCIDVVFRFPSDSLQ